MCRGAGRRGGELTGKYSVQDMVVTGYQKKKITYVQLNVSVRAHWPYHPFASTSKGRTDETSHILKTVIVILSVHS